MTQDPNSVNIEWLKDANKSTQRSLSEIKRTLKDGFKGVHDRQDESNHRTAKAEARIKTLEDRHSGNYEFWKPVLQKFIYIFIGGAIFVLGAVMRSAGLIN